MTSAIESTKPVRQAILQALKADAALTALVPAARIYPSRTPANPVWPFIRYGTPTDLPQRASCMAGSLIVVAVHCFTKASSAFPDAEGLADDIKAAMVSAVEWMPPIELSIGGRAYVIYTGGQVLQDGAEADAYHGIVNLEIMVVGPSS